MACEEVACFQADSKESQRCPEVYSSTKLQHACISTRIKRAEVRYSASGCWQKAILCYPAGISGELKA
jgi:hypothetical protein